MSAALRGSVVNGRFVIESVAGSGGMGTVWRAQDRRSGAIVALKVCNPGGDDGTHEARFTREAELLATLRHPGIVSYVDHGWTPEGVPYLAMEWLDGEDLAARLLREPLTTAQSRELLCKLTEALAAAHGAGIIHRDLKPSNVFLRDGRIERATLVDFGIARRGPASITKNVTATGVVLGTPQYMAPEQARCERNIGPAVDIYSLGCVVFECLAGRPPFVAGHLAAILAKIVFEEAPALSSVRHDVPPALAALVARMLAKEPSRRPQDASALSAELATLPPLSEVDAATLPPEQVRFTGSEQQILCVVLAMIRPAAGAGSIQVEDHLAELRAALDSYQCRVEALADGPVAIVFNQTGYAAATDRAIQAARCALLIKEQWPAARIALATGRGLLREETPTAGDALERAAGLLEGAASQSNEGGGSVVWVDDITAGFLEASFVLGQADGGRRMLLHERITLDESRPLLGKPTPCVGREQELSTLAATLESCIDEPCARAVVVRAPPGTGKSRLRHEFLRRSAKRWPDLTVLIGRADAMSAGSSYGLLGQALRRLAGIVDGAPPEEQRSLLAAFVGARVPATTAPQMAAFLGEFCGIPFPDDGLPALRCARQDAGLMADQIAQAFLAFLRAECSVRPVLLVLEDLHWGDTLTVRLCDAALRELLDLPLMVLALARPEVDALFPRMWEERAWHNIALSGLNKRACERLIREVLGDEVPAAVVERIARQSAGNALFLEELIRAVAEGRGDALPETVLAMLQARLMALAPGARQVLRAASIFGETFWKGGVRALSGEPFRDEVEDWLATLIKLEIVAPHRESRLAGESELAFRHALLRDGAYSMLSERDRRAGHRLAGQFLEAAGERDPMVLAEHWERGGDHARAGDHYLRAAEQALRGGDAEASVARAERGLSCGAEGIARTALLAMLAEAHGWRGRFDLGAPYAEEVLRSAVPGSAAWAAAYAVKQEGRCDPELAALLFDTDPIEGAIGPYAFACMTSATGALKECQWSLMKAVLSRAHAVVDPVATRDPLGRGWLEVTRSFVDAIEPGEPWSAMAWAEASRASFEEIGHRRGALFAQIYVGMNLWLLGSIPEAIEHLRATLVAGVEFGPDSAQRTAWLVEALLDRGPASLEEAHPIAEEAARSSERSGMARAMGLSKWALSDVLRRREDLGNAEREARSACELLQRDLRFGLGLARSTLAEILRAQGRAAEALVEAEEAFSLYEANRLFHYKGERVRLVRAECLAAAGDAAGARAALEEARESLLAKTTRIPDPAQRRRFLEEVPENTRLLRLCPA